MSNFRNITAAGGESIIRIDPAEVVVGQPWSVGMWLRPNTLTGTQCILRLGTTDNAPTRGILWAYSSTTLRLRTAGNQADGTWTPVSNTWYRLGVTKANVGIGQIRHIVDGTDVGGTNMDVPTALTTGDPFQIGDTTVGGLGYSPLDAGVAWAFWVQGATLSAAQIDAYLNDPQSLIDDFGPSGTVTPNALKLFWPMQCDTVTEEDQSGLNNDGTRNGTVDLVTVAGPTPTTEWDVCAAPPSPQRNVIQFGTGRPFFLNQSTSNGHPMVITNE